MGIRHLTPALISHLMSNSWDVPTVCGLTVCRNGAAWPLGVLELHRPRTLLTNLVAALVASVITSLQKLRTISIRSMRFPSFARGGVFLSCSRQDWEWILLFLYAPVLSGIDGVIKTFQRSMAVDGAMNSRSNGLS